jgi:PKD repeat protein
VNCINGAPQGGSSCNSWDGVGVASLGIVSLGSLTTPPTTGLVFTITYSIVTTTTGTPVTFLSNPGCSGQSITGTNDCVLITAGSATVPETDQGAFFVNSATFYLSASPTSAQIKVGQSGTSTITARGFVSYTGTVTLMATINSTATGHPVPSVVPPTIVLTSTTTSGTSTLTVPTLTSSQAGGYNITVTGSDGSQTRAVSFILRVVAVPSLSTTPSNNPIVVGNSVSDSATLTGASTKAGGTVTYNLFTTSSCTGTPQLISTVAVTAGVVPSSRSIPINSTGTLSLNATYSGDFYDQSASTCEQLTVNRASPTISTTLSSTTINPGTTATDTVTVIGGFFGPRNGAPFSSIVGNVTYTLFTGSSCTGTSNIISKVTVNGNTGIVPASRAVTFNSTGTWSWNATYTGDANNNPAANHTCEVLTVKIIADFQISSASSTVSLQVGATAPVTISLTSVQSFAGPVSLTYTTTPTLGLSLTCNPNPVTLQANQMATSTCTFYATSVNMYTVVVSGNNTAFQLSHSIAPAITVTVTMTHPTISTQLFNATDNTPLSITAGAAIVPLHGKVYTSMYDTATISGAFSATRSVTYNEYNGFKCAGSPQSFTVTISNGNVPHLTPSMLPSFTAGNYSFTASYGGDGNNTATTASPCEILTVNSIPFTIFTVSSQTSLNIVGTPVNFNATSSYDPDATILKDSIAYTWYFGEGTPVISVTAMTSHTYSTAGSYTVTLTVTDLYGGQNVTSRTIQVIHPSVSIVSAKLSTATPTVGDTVTLTVDILNNGSVPLSFNVTMTVNGQTVDQTQIVVQPGQENNAIVLHWNTAGFQATSYTISAQIVNSRVNDPSGAQVPLATTAQGAGTIALQAPNTSPLPGGTSLWIIIGVIAAIAIVAGVIIVLRRRKTVSV